jgi:hypothetical protein
MSSLDPYRPRSLDRPTRRTHAGLDAATDLTRAHDRARAELAAARITNLAKATRHGIGAAALIAAEAEMATQLSPWAAQQIAAVAGAGLTGIRAVVVDLSTDS